jgi:hypothetical protein
MKRIAAFLVAVAALLGSSLAGTALGQDTNPEGVLAAPQAFNAQQGWNDGPDQDRNDQARYRDDSDWDRNGSNWGSARGRFNILDGRWVADNRAADYRSDRGAFRGRGPMSQMLLPSVIRIDQKPSVVRIADSKNHALQLIMLGDKFSSRYRGKPDYLVGYWQGRTLVVERTMPRGATITQTFALQNRGRTLVVRTRHEGFGWRGASEVTNTYYRA